MNPLDMPDPPDWPGLGGRGELAGKAALCLLRDLGVFHGGDGIRNLAEVDLGVLGKAGVTQRVGLEKFDPVARTMQGFHGVSVCMPVFGCVDDQTQSFTAELLKVGSTSVT